MKVAIVHDFLVKLGGAERVVKAISDMFPEAPIYSLVYDENAVGKVFPKDKVKTSFIQDYPKFIRKRYQFLIPKMPRAIEELNFEEYDLVISSNTAFSHGIITPVKTKHVCYCHSPMRYAWDWTNEYRKEHNISGIKNLLYTPLLKYLREWDIIAADRPNLYIANSKNVQSRIKKYYKQDSSVVYPPVDTGRFRIGHNNENYFLIVSTLSPYKRIDLAVQLFNKLGRKLVIIGEGSHRKYLESIAGDNIDFLGFKDDSVVREYMESCRAFIFLEKKILGLLL